MQVLDQRHHDFRNRGSDVRCITASAATVTSCSRPIIIAHSRQRRPRATTLRSYLEEHRLVVALQVNVEAIDCVAIAICLLGDQRGAAIDRHQRQHGIGRIGGFAAEIDPRIEMQQHAAREHRQHDMRRLRLAVGIRHDAGLDSVEGVAAILVGANAAKTLERRIRQQVPAAVCPMRCSV